MLRQNYIVGRLPALYTKKEESLFANRVASNNSADSSSVSTTTMMYITLESLYGVAPPPPQLFFNEIAAFEIRSRRPLLTYGAPSPPDVIIQIRDIYSALQTRESKCECLFLWHHSSCRAAMMMKRSLKKIAASGGPGLS